MVDISDHAFVIGLQQRKLLPVSFDNVARTNISIQGKQLIFAVRAEAYGVTTSSGI